MTRNHIAHFAVAVALAAAASIPAGSAWAASTICAEIAARLASLDAAPPGRSGGYDHAIAVQQRELRRADEEMRRLRCGFSVSGSAIERCASLARQTDAMEANLAELRRGADNVPDPYSLERARLLRLSNAKGCDRQPPPGDVVRILRPGAVDGLALTAPAYGDPNHIVLRPRAADIDPNGSYRTMCVRTCDGYYFPISYAVTSAQFAADEAACQRRCPGTDVRLYFHRVPEEDSERMISVSDGTPYTALPHAFLYRQFGRSAPAGCTCQEAVGSFSSFTGVDTISQRGYQVLSPGEGAKQTVEGSIVSIPARAPKATPPVAEPAKAQKEPEQQAKIKPADVAAPARPLPASRRDIRVVGPKFLPDPSEAEVLRTPGPTPGR